MARLFFQSQIFFDFSLVAGGRHLFCFLAVESLRNIGRSFQVSVLHQSLWYLKQLCFVVQYISGYCCSVENAERSTSSIDSLMFIRSKHKKYYYPCTILCMHNTIYYCCHNLMVECRDKSSMMMSRGAIATSKTPSAHCTYIQYYTLCWVDTWVSLTVVRSKPFN